MVEDSGRDIGAPCWKAALRLMPPEPMQPPWAVPSCAVPRTEAARDPPKKPSGAPRLSEGLTSPAWGDASLNSTQPWTGRARDPSPS